VTAHRHPGPNPRRAGRPLDRRTVLRGGLTLGALGLGGVLLGSCGDDASTSVADGATPDHALIAAFPQGVPHVAAGVPARLPYLIADKEGVPLSAIDGPVRFTVQADGKPVGSPVTVQPHAQGVPRAYLPFTFTFPRTGLYDIYAEYQGDRLDSNLQVYDASRVGPPLVGERLPPVNSPTTNQTLDVDPLCSRVPACPFHEINLQDAVGQGRPIVLLVATPAYCQTAVCGPVLDTLVDVIGGRTDLAVLHNEVYKNPKAVRDLQDAALAPVPAAYELSFEPVLFVTDAAGTVVARGDITVDRAEMASMLELAR
jgi:hypothetical protein